MIGQLIDLPKIIDTRGNLTVVEQMRQIPFDIARVYWTYDIQEVVVAVSGSFDVQLYNGREWETYHLNHPYQGLYIGTSIWRTLEDFSSGAVCLVLASELFDEDEYIYDMDEFEKLYASCLI